MNAHPLALRLHVVLLTEDVAVLNHQVLEDLYEGGQERIGWIKNQNACGKEEFGRIRFHTGAVCKDTYEQR